MFRSVWDWLWGLIRPAKEEPSAPTRKPRKPRPEVYGSFYFRDAILDQLDHYFVILGRMKKGDRQSYDLFSRIGAHITPTRTAEWFEKTPAGLPPWWRETLPGRGGVFFGDSEIEATEKKEKSFYPRALHFMKYRPHGVPVEVQPVNTGTVYMMAVYWDKLGDEKWQKLAGGHGVSQDYPVVIGEDGSIRVLRTLETKYVQGRGKRGKFYIPVRRWGIPKTYQEWADQHGQKAEDYLRWLFIHAAETYMMANASMTRVSVTKGHLTGIFAVDIERTPYFFRDREVTVNDKGTRKRIFHVVRAHERMNGATVRLHFRGERQFNWNGYAISITVPGWHHLNLAEINIGSLDGESEEGQELKTRPKKVLTSKGYAQRLTGWISNGLGGEREKR